MNPPGYLLLPKPGLCPDQLAVFLHECGLRRIADRGPGPQRRRCWSDDAGEHSSTVEYWEDRTLGQRQLYALGPRAKELSGRCATRWPCWSPEEVLAAATFAATPADKVGIAGPAGSAAHRPGPVRTAGPRHPQRPARR